ncbi:hypothetical protein TgHK011_001094 [Trichoderma gracile]|nr:hypothetical protein TgHK011_001094 [Trichoderma gracile]
MASPTEHDVVDFSSNLAPDAPAAMKATVTRTDTKTDQIREIEEEEFTDPKMSYNWTYWHARFTVLNDYQDLPCPVETRGAHLISAPPSPKAVAPRHDPRSFYKDLFERLRGLALRQSVRENIYGVEFASEWPISRTPRPLADEVREARKKAQDALLHLDSSSSSDPEYEPAWMRRMREAREKRRRARAQAKAEGVTRAKAATPSQLSPPQDDAVINSEQQTVDAVADDSCKKRKAPPTPISPASPKRVRNSSPPTCFHDKLSRPSFKMDYVEHRMNDEALKQATNSTTGLISPLNIALLLILLYTAYTTFLSKPTYPILPRPPPPIVFKTYTPHTLLPFNGEDNKPVFLAVRGAVYDVSRGRNFYGPGDLDGPLDDLKDLGDEEMEALRGWEERFSEKYDVIGRLVSVKEFEEMSKKE